MKIVVVQVSVCAELLTTAVYIVTHRQPGGCWTETIILLQAGSPEMRHTEEAMRKHFIYDLSHTSIVAIYTLTGPMITRSKWNVVESGALARSHPNPGHCGVGGPC
jgi:hypothetical protein